MIRMLQCAPLNPLRFPLVERFYKTHYKVSKPNKNETIWTLETQGKIIGAVRFKQFEQHKLLTGLAIDENFRRQGMGLFLLEQSLAENMPCYCFAYSHLRDLYISAGFTEIGIKDLPEELEKRFVLYTSHGKNLISMQCTKK